MYVEEDQRYVCLGKESRMKVFRLRKSRELPSQRNVHTEHLRKSMMDRNEKKGQRNTEHYRK